MRMLSNPRRYVMVAVLALVLAAFSGCGGGSTAEESTASVVSGKIDDGAKPLVDTQARCPVCDEHIKKDVHTEAQEQRVYFDKKECLEKYRQNPEKYRQNVLQQGL